ncbi:MAG TPA: hypothetical protein PLD59_15390 [Tepidisphaeraceae bacterium]|nr:hypothetical protein [Tepidisphaeraceae bacterium]
MSHAGENDLFPTTDWDLFIQLKSEVSPDRSDALRVLLTRYGPAIHRFLRLNKGMNAADADDLQSAFIVDKLLQSTTLFDRAEATRGRFRSFLVRSLQNYLTDRHRRTKARHEEPLTSAHLEEASLPTAESDAFDHAWACSVLQQALANTQTYLLNTDQSDTWEVFDRRIAQPILGDCEPTPYSVLAAELSLEGPIQASNLLSSAKRVFSRQLQSILADQAGPGEAFSQQLVDLREIFSRPAG